MNETLNLLVRSIRFIWKNPVVLLPAAVARVADFLISLGANALRGPAVMAVAPRSVLGGVAGKLTTPVLVVSSLLAVVPLLIEVLLFVYALLVCARWSHALREGAHTVPRTWSVDARPVFRNAALTFAVSAVTVGVGTYFSIRGGAPLQWVPMISACFLLIASWFLVPSWVGMIAAQQGSPERERSRVPPFIAFALAFLVAAAIVHLGSVARQFLGTHYRSHSELVSLLVAVVTACLSSLPLAFSFVAMSRWASDRSGWQAD